MKIVKWALIQGNWSRSYTGTGMFFPTNVILFDDEKKAWEKKQECDKKYDTDFYVMPVTEDIVERFIK